jgi:uncharacterized RmlC-like cupin family protein
MKTLCLILRSLLLVPTTAVGAAAARVKGPMSDPACVVVGSDRTYRGAQGFSYFEGISAQSAGARGLCLHRLEIPPGAGAHPHLHEHHETAIYVLQGRARMRYGRGLREQLEVRAGQFLFIPAGMPHLPFNPSDRETCVAVLARTDPNEQESVVLLDQHGRRPRTAGAPGRLDFYIGRVR